MAREQQEGLIEKAISYINRYDPTLTLRIISEIEENIIQKGGKENHATTKKFNRRTREKR